MNIRRTLFISLFLFIPYLTQAQITGFSDDFSNGSLDTLWNDTPITLWTTNSTNTYGISEADGVLKIAYDRNSASGSKDYVRFASPEAVDVSENPKIRFSIRSNVSTTVLFRSVFGTRVQRPVFRPVFRSERTSERSG